MANTAVIMVDPSRAAVAVMISLLNFNLNASTERYIVSKVVSLRVELGRNSPPRLSSALGHNGPARTTPIFQY